MYYYAHILYKLLYGFFSERSVQVHADLFIGPTICIIQNGLIQNPQYVKGIHD